MKCSILMIAFGLAVLNPSFAQSQKPSAGDNHNTTRVISTPLRFLAFDLVKLDDKTAEGKIHTQKEKQFVKKEINGYWAGMNWGLLSCSYRRGRSLGRYSDYGTQRGPFTFWWQRTRYSLHGNREANESGYKRERIGGSSNSLAQR
jgi:hypothetical protein